MKRRRPASIVFSLSLLAAAVAAPLIAEDRVHVVTRPKYVRLERDKLDRPVALQTAVVQFLPDDAADRSGVTVDLVGAVHVGEKAYYEALNKLFEKYDAVLYELVAPEGTKIPKGAKTGGHPVAMLQNGLKGMLDLEHQLEHVDYTKGNMVHADMSPDDFSKSMTDRGESFFTMMVRMMGQAMAQQSLQKNKTSEFDLLTALFDRDRAGSLKRMMAEQFETMEGAMDALEGPKGSTIVGERNKVALKRLAEQIAGGKKKIAIFYGAGHMNDLEKRLVADFHMHRGTTDWLTAWKLEKAAPAKVPALKQSASTVR